jgi:hypothetical protein
MSKVSERSSEFDKINKIVSIFERSFFERNSMQ